jgi:hypothetical protein
MLDRRRMTSRRGIHCASAASLLAGPLLARADEVIQ